MPVPSFKKKQMVRARAWILEHPKASIAETMRATGLSQSSVSNIRRELIASGLQAERPHTPNPTPIATSTEDLLKSEDPEVEGIIEGTIPMTREKRKAKLEALIEHGAPDHIIRANTALEQMERNDATKETVAPPAPETLDDAIVETADIIEALMAWGGEPAVKQAVNTGMSRFHEDQKRQQQETVHQSPSLEPTNV